MEKGLTDRCFWVMFKRWNDKQAFASPLVRVVVVVPEGVDVIRDGAADEADMGGRNE